MPPRLKVTVPPIRLPAGSEVTVAVNVTPVPDSALLLLDATAVAVVPRTTLMVKVCDRLLFTPPFAVPPLSLSVTVTTAEPVRPDAGVNVSVPFGATAGWAENSALLVLVAAKVRAWPASFAGPALDRRRPVGHRLHARIHHDRLVGALGEARRVVHRR